VKKPYPLLLALSVLITFIYFQFEQPSPYLSREQLRHGYITDGILFVALLFAAFSAIYLYAKKDRR
jgi:hypothetical protein